MEFFTNIEKELMISEARLTKDEIDFFELIRYKCMKNIMLSSKEIICIDRMVKIHEYDWFNIPSTG